MKLKLSIAKLTLTPLLGLSPKASDEELGALFRKYVETAFDKSTLDLSEINKLDDRTFKAFVIQATDLNALVLDGCSISAKCLLMVTPSVCKLTSLSLKKMHLVDEDAPALANALAPLKALTYLDLSKNKLSDGAVPPLVSRFAKMTTLTKLMLSGNKITAVGQSLLEDQLNPPLEADIARIVAKPAAALLKRAQEGDASSQYQVAMFYLENLPDPKMKEPFAIKWLEKAANQGYADAQEKLIVCYFNGNGTEKNKTLARNWCDALWKNEKCSKEQKAWTAYMLGLIWEGFKNVDSNQCFKWLKIAVELGFEHAQERLDYNYSLIPGVPSITEELNAREARRKEYDDQYKRLYYKY